METDVEINEGKYISLCASGGGGGGGIGIFQRTFLVGDGGGVFSGGFLVDGRWHLINLLHKHNFMTERQISTGLFFPHGDIRDAMSDNYLLLLLI